MKSDTVEHGRVQAAAAQNPASQASGARSDLAAGGVSGAEAAGVGAAGGSKSANPLRTIILIIGCAIAVFLVFTSYSVITARQAQSQLADIKSQYFPVLERVDAIIVRVDKMEEKYTQVAMTGDRDPMDEAAELCAKADAALAEIEALYAGHQEETQVLRGLLEKYRSQAVKTSVAVLEKTSPNLGADIMAMRQTLAKLREGIQTYRDASYSNFVEALASSQRTTRLNMILGIAIGVMNLCFMGVLVYFIRNNVKMIAIVAEQNATLEKRVSERTAELSRKTNDIAAMLRNMKLGVCTVVPGNLIHPEHSNYLCTIACSETLAEEPLLPAIFGKSDLGVDVQNQIAVALESIINEDAMMFEFNEHLLPREMQLMVPDGPAKIIQMAWTPIVGDTGTVDKVLLILQDVTHLRELEQKASAQREELEIIARILKVPVGKFNDFIESACGFSASCRDLIEQGQAGDQAVIASLFRNMHTIKGNARTFQFTHVTNVAHRAEQSYDHLRKDKTAAWDKARLLEELDAVDAAIWRYAQTNDETLGRKGRAADLLTSRGAFLSNELIAELRDVVAKATLSRASTDLERVRELVDGLGFVPLERIVSGAKDAAESVAKELGKPVPRFDLAGGAYAFTPPIAEALKSSLMHIVRNCLDHGIELPEERLASGKPAQGTLQFQCAAKGDHVELRIRDDGRGLALHRILEKARANGLVEAAEEPSLGGIASMIFLPGLSTTNEVTQVSGRGVGMDAVRTFLGEHQADVTIELDRTDGEPGFAAFAFVMRFPAAACHALKVPDAAGA